MVCCNEMFVLAAGLIPVLFVSLTYGRTVTISDDTAVAGPTVHHFARHAICHTIEGKIKFYNTMADYLCELSEDIRVSLVLDLCDRKSEMLDKWVKEIYDVDGDGYISHHERKYHDV